MLERMDMGRGFYGGFGAYSGLVGIGWCIFCVDALISLTRNREETC